MHFAARGLGARIAIGASLFEPECAPAGVRTGDLLGPRRPVGPDASSTGLQLRSNLIFKPILEKAQIGTPALGFVLETARQRGGLN